MNEKKRAIREELDELEKEKVKEIGTYNGKWVESFLIRFHKQAQEHDMTNKEICEAVRNKRPLEVNPAYELIESTLSNYTSVKGEKTPRPPQIDTLIALANVFDVSIDYLLGIEEKENHELTDIYKATGLNTNAIRAVQGNDVLKSILNKSVTDEQFFVVLDDILKMRKRRSLYRGVMSDYKNYQEQIEAVFEKFCENEFLPISRNKDVYAQYLRQELYKSIMQNGKSDDLIKEVQENISDSLFYQLVCEMENTSNANELFDRFIERMADDTYSLLEYKHNEEIELMKMSQTIVLMLNKYIDTPMK